jgi:HEAT repeat protein
MSRLARAGLGLLLFILVNGRQALGAEQSEPVYLEKPLGAWVADLRHRDHAVRYDAAMALGAIGKPAIPSLLTALKSTDPEVRIVAATGLGRIGPDAKVAVAPLINALKDKDRDVRRKAAEALGGIGPAARAAIPPLIEALDDLDITASYSPAADALGRIGKASVEPLFGALRSDDRIVRRMATVALTAIGSEAKAAVPALRRASRPTRPSCG